MCIVPAAAPRNLKKLNNYNLMKSITKLLAASALAMSMAAGCTDYDNEISRLDDRVDQIEGTQIKSISQQIDAINLSLPKLEKTDAELKSYIESLQKSSDELEKSIAAANAKLADVQKALEKAVADAKSGDSALKDELVASINNAKADVVSQLNALKTEMAGKLDLVNNTIEELQDRDKDIEIRIDELKCYSDSLAKVTRDWVSETFVMVDEYSKTVDDVASLKVLVESLDNSLSSVESKLAGQWKSDIETAIAPVRKQIEDAVLTMTGEYESAISDARKELTEAYQGELKNGLSDLESSMKSWINGQFDSYWSIDSTKAALASLRFDLETQLNTQKTYLETLIGNLSPGSGSGGGSVSKSLIDSLSTQLENTRKSVADNNAAIQAMQAELNTSIENVTESYKSAIETAVKENNGNMDEKIEAKVKEANSVVASEVKEIGEAVSSLDARVKTLEDSVSEIKTQISSLQDSIKALEDKISGIISQIASITYVPTYSDGMETVTYTTSGSDIVPGTFTLRLKIQPASLADDLAENWKTALSAEAVYTKTRSVAGDFVSLTIEDAAASDGVLAVTVSASALSEDFFNKALSASARITVTAPTSGQNISSQYVALESRQLNFYSPRDASKGDFAMSDGSFVSINDAGLLTDSQKAKCSGVVFWVMPVPPDYGSYKTPGNLSDDKVLISENPYCTHGLIVSLYDAYRGNGPIWQDRSESIADLQSTLVATTADGAEYKSIASGKGPTDNINYILGYQNTKILNAYNEYCTVNSKTENIVLPVVSISEYEKSHPSPLNSSGWFLPSPKELHLLLYKDTDDIFKTFDSSYRDTMALVDKQMKIIGGDLLELSENHILVSSTEYTDSHCAFFIEVMNSQVNYFTKYSFCTHRVRAVCAF